MSDSNRVSACITSIYTSVPSNRIDNLNDINLNRKQAEKVLENTGIRFRYKANKETSSDLCYFAASKLLVECDLDKNNIEFLVFVSQTPDYILPATAAILQDRLGLPKSVAAFDVNMGCSGYIYGLSIISSLIQTSTNKNAAGLLLVGDTISKICDINDTATYPLFGDAGSATLIERSDDNEMVFDMNTDGGGCDAIKVKYGGFKNFNEIKPISLHLNGMDVFSFGITTVPKALKRFIKELKINTEEIDFFIFHQANKFMNEKIRKKIKALPEQVPYSLHDFANTSSATIPLTLTTQVKKVERDLQLLLCGFGVGLSWGSAFLTLKKGSVLKHIIYDE
ncbi:ketoacyl-ACP synthase III [Nonlabens sp. SCSIO 43208]|uniref:3-oxoacyl-ACP synthase III family protein n=1 Tax=Nonlabens sp. SCSIO 43208 TaxID=2793009 RepID=UPI003D6A6CAD